MNKILISILLVATLFSCTKNSYTLRGTAESADLNGAVINISEFYTQNRIGEVTIENQKFVFRGVVEEPIMVSLILNHPNGGSAFKIFILENAKINFHITENMEIEVSGSKENNLLQSFIREVNSRMHQEFIDSIRNNLLPESEWLPRLERYQEETLHIVVDFATKNVNTLAGTFIFMDYHHSLPLEDQIAILNLMNKTTRNNPQIQEIAQQVEAEKRIAPGKMYLDFTLPTPTGEILSLSDLLGKHDYVLVNFWASWCAPCIRSLPELIAFYNKHAGKSFEILGVSLDSNADNWKRAIETHNIPWQQVSDLNSEVQELYAVEVIPTRVLIDRSGKIVGRNMSLSEIAELLK